MSANKQLAEQVTTLRGMLQSIEGQLQRSDTPPEGLEDFKATVDDIRTSVWAILSASRSRDYQSFIERFRLRRANEICRAVLGEVAAGGMKGDYPELGELHEAIKLLAERLPRPKSG